MKPSHSSITTKVMAMSGTWEDRLLQKFIMGPCPGYGIATMWRLPVAATAEVDDHGASIFLKLPGPRGVQIGGLFLEFNQGC
ncbi:hypothetical protein NL676_005798 [Syzygium grande]|nr:hypothetical protein NL676_005798 [Syzygium grande]